MVYIVVSVYGADGIKVERQIKNVAKVKVKETLTLFYDLEGEVLAGFSNDGLLYYERISMG